MFDYSDNDKPKLPYDDIRTFHKGSKIYTNIYELVMNMRFIAEIPSAFLAINNTKHLPEDEKEFVLSFYEYDNDPQTFVRTSLTINDLLEACKYNYPFLLVNYEDTVLVYMYLKFYYDYIKNIKNTNEEIYNRIMNDLSKTNRNKSEQSLNMIKKELNNIQELMNRMKSKVKRILYQHSDLSEKFKDILIQENIFKGYELN